ncbi:MAG: glycoside hydrolase family 15 protein [Candidatus Nanopelagicales bacterium]
MAGVSDYALIGDTRTAALVSRQGSIDWLCAPRFDSGAFFAALLGTRENGTWELAPDQAAKEVRRRYVDDSLVLETEFTTRSGRVVIRDCMVVGSEYPIVVRVAQGLSGTVPMRSELALRFDYGSVVPWVRQEPGRLHGVAGPDAVVLDAPVRWEGHDFVSSARFVVEAGQSVGFVLAYYPSHEPVPHLDPAEQLLDRTRAWWQSWMQGFDYEGPWDSAVRRSVMVLKALTYAPTGGIVAAPTTSLPEDIGGVRNWDYRYCWVRDSTFTLYALMLSGFHEEARRWRQWIQRAAAGRPEDLQILYGLHGERRLPERALDWLPGYQHSRPVRVGNAAGQQFQLDVYGELIDVLHLARRVDPPAVAELDPWPLQRALLDFLERAWTRPDRSLWEVRGPERHYTFSKVMSWVAFDRAAKAVQRHGLPGPAARWRRVADTIHAQVCQEAFDRDRGTFVQAYGSKALDAALLMLPLVGFLPATDERIVGTVAAIEQRLLCEGLVRRYLPEESDDGLPGGEGVFLPCSFWLADNYALQGRRREAEALFERLVGLANDVGLLSEEYDPRTAELIGNFPQAFTHVALINTAHNLSPKGGPALHRPDPDHQDRP